MLRILLHILVMPAMLWLERRSGPRLRPSRAALAWYVLGLPLMAVEASVSGRDGMPVFLQSAIVALFFLPPAYFAFRYARRHGGVWKPFLLYLALSCIAGVVAALSLAHAPLVLGSVWKA